MPLIKKEYLKEIYKDGIAIQEQELKKPGLSDEEIEQLRQKIISAATVDGDKIKADALKLAESIKEKAYRDGLDAGRKEASRSMEKNIQESLQVIDNARLEKQRIMEDTEEDILTLSTKIATKLMNSELTIRPDIIMNVVKDAITKISDNKDIILRVAQEDLEEVRSHKELIEELMDTRNLTITADRKIEQGGCMIETKLGFIDARIATKTEMILSSLLHIYRDDKLKEEAGLITRKVQTETTLEEDEDNYGDDNMENYNDFEHPLAGEDQPKVNNILDDLDF